MKNTFVKLVPGFFACTLMCCGGTLQDALGEADYTKYKEEQGKKTEVVLKKIAR